MRSSSAGGGGTPLSIRPRAASLTDGSRLPHASAQVEDGKREPDEQAEADQHGREPAPPAQAAVRRSATGHVGTARITAHASAPRNGASTVKLRATSTATASSAKARSTNCGCSGGGEGEATQAPPKSRAGVIRGDRSGAS